MTHYILCLHPLVTVRIRQPLVEEGFIHHRTVGSQTFIGGCGDEFHQWLHLVQQCLVAQHQRRLVQQLGSLDVMPVRDNVVPTVPVVIEEKFQVPGLNIQNLVREEFDEVMQLPLQAFVFPHAVKVRIGFQDV